jgi:hypothetical protein
MDEPEFSLDDFKSWMKVQKDFDAKMPKDETIGAYVEAKIPGKKILSKICVEEGDLYEVASDFRRHGGTVINVDGKSLLVEVNAGTFYIPRQYVRKR